MKNDTVYIAGVNCSGLWSRKPLRAEKLDETPGWWAAEEGILQHNVCALKLGLDTENRIITFASTSKKEVQIWIDGVRSAFKLLKTWIA